ncbi:unnamed protein product [Penicillium salamii]|nr:unnamed protein product [Penicillium salamii]CAG8355557.1 unnamed protein product [Penicillium salamii]
MTRPMPSTSPLADPFPQAPGLPRPDPQYHTCVPKISKTSTMQESGTVRAKVPIPRLRSIIARQTHRASRACQSCRQTKAKCSGDSPICRRCRELKAPCCYTLTKREQIQR